MERVEMDALRPAPAVLRRAVNFLREGGVIAYPTETFYALGANPFDAAACSRVFQMKGRSAAKALPLIVADFEQLELISDRVPDAARRLAERFWPGPLTLVIPARGNLGGCLSGLRTVAVRVSGLFLARELARTAGLPLTATSANPSGFPPARTAVEVEYAFPVRLGAGCLVLDGGPTTGESPSTMVDLCSGRPRLIRRGAVSYEEVIEALGGWRRSSGS